MSRSGGTLMVTILDAHPDVAMSYELYPELLNAADPSAAFLERLVERLEAGDKLKTVANLDGGKDFYSFVVRLPRGGIHEREFLALLRDHLAEGMSFATPKERLIFMQRCCVQKMKVEGKKRWGLKCSSRFDEYLEIWPHACFINMVRDGRDVLASTLNTGAFNKDITRIARGWANTMRIFLALMARPGVNAYPVVYERLTANPQEEVRKLCDELHLEFVPEMLDFHEKDLTIFHTRHLSSNRISKPIDTSMIGRWQKELTPGQLDEFYAAAGDMMNSMGYPREEHAH